MHTSAEPSDFDNQARIFASSVCIFVCLLWFSVWIPPSDHHLDICNFHITGRTEHCDSTELRTISSDHRRTDGQCEEESCDRLGDSLNLDVMSFSPSQPP